MKSFGQIAYEASTKGVNTSSWDDLLQSTQERWEVIASTTLAAQWRSVDDPPYNIFEEVILAGGGAKFGIHNFDNRMASRTHWMSIPQLPKPKEPTPIEIAQREFEIYYQDSLNLEKTWKQGETYYNNDTEQRWLGFKAAKGL